MERLIVVIFSALMFMSCSGGGDSGGTTGGSGLTDEQNVSCDIAMLSFDPSDMNTANYDCYDPSGVTQPQPRSR